MEVFHEDGRARAEDLVATINMVRALRGPDAPQVGTHGVRIQRDYFDEQSVPAAAGFKPEDRAEQSHGPRQGSAAGTYGPGRARDPVSQAAHDQAWSSERPSSRHGDVPVRGGGVSGCV